MMGRQRKAGWMDTEVVGVGEPGGIQEREEGQGKELPLP